LDWKDYLSKRDFEAALTILELDRKCKQRNDPRTLHAIAYCSFHVGNYSKAMEIYDSLMASSDYDKNIHAYKACCMYALCDFKDAKEEAMKAEDSPLRNRLLFHLTEKTGGDDNEIMQYHSALVAGVQD